MAMVSLEHRVRSVVSLFLLLIIFGCQQKTKKPDVSIAYYPDTHDTLSVQLYLDGKEHGRWVKYHPDGSLMEERFFDHGKKTGIMKGWWANGQLQSLYHFYNDEYEGECSDWNDKGVLIRRMHYIKGHEDGLQQQWYDDGSVRSNYVIVKGRRYGLLGTKNCVNVSDSLDMY